MPKPPATTEWERGAEVSTYMHAGATRHDRGGVGGAAAGARARTVVGMTVVLRLWGLGWLWGLGGL